MNLSERVDDLLHTGVREGQAPGAVAAVAVGEEIHVSAAGAMAVEGPPMRPDALFRIASVSKPITAAAVLALVDEGLLDLDGAVDALLPELADRRVLRDASGPIEDTVPARRPVTVRDLLTFTWGFGMQGAMLVASEPWPIVSAARDRELHTFESPQPARMLDPDTWIARLGELPLMAQPGERWLYQSGSQVLSILAARAAGAPFEEVLRDRVFGPLCMRDTVFHSVDTDRIPTLYVRGEGELTVLDPPDGQWSRPPAFSDGSGCLLSTAEDVVAFGRMLLRGGGPVLGAETTVAMTRDQLTDEQKANVWTGFDLLDGRGWGFGTSVFDGCYGWDGGFGTTWANDASRDLTVVVLTQRMWDRTGPPAVCTDVLAAARAATPVERTGP